MRNESTKYCSQAGQLSRSFDKIFVLQNGKQLELKQFVHVHDKSESPTNTSASVNGPVYLGSGVAGVVESVGLV